MSIKIDVTMTATARPEIVKKTLDSFWNNLFNSAPEIDYRLVVNIDSITSKYDEEVYAVQEKIAAICKSYFPNNCISITDVPNFAAAFKWTWDSIRDDARFIFHLEDDWELLRPVNLLQMLTLFIRYQNLITLRLNAFPSKECQTKNWNLLLPWNGDFFEVTRENRGTVGICGHPSLIEGNFVRYARKFLNGKSNPEKSLKGHQQGLRSLFEIAQIGVYSKQNSPPLIKDIGREWRIKNGIHKKGPAAFFTEWVKK